MAMGAGIKSSKMNLWECKVAVTHKPGYSNVPTTLQTRANTFIQAKAYFQTFGQLLSEPRIIQPETP
jgi:hypothetical protein